MQKKQSSPSHRAMNVELWDQISVNLIWIFCCSVYLRGNMWRENGGSCFIICTHPQDTWHTWNRGEKCTKFWWGSPERKRPLGRRRHRKEEGIRMDLRENGRWCELDSTSSGYRQVASYRYISMPRWIHIDISRSINIDISRLTTIDISRPTNVDISR
jgi:hypothetical protein